jgi:SulP family sulfate permease
MAATMVARWPHGLGGGSVKRDWLSNWRGDLAGGVTAALLTIPVSMGYGILAMYPLGERYVSYGLLAGLSSAIVVPLVAVLLGADTSMMYAPRSVVAFLLSSIALHGLVRSRAGVVDVSDVGQVLVLFFFVVLVAGLFQALLGALRLGSLVQYIPSPVMAGFQNAAAVLILLSQLDSLLGFPRHVAPLRIMGHLGSVQPLTLLVGVVTALGMWHAGSVSKQIPPAMMGLAAGSGLYYVIKAAGLGGGLGPTIGAMPSLRLGPGYLPAFWALGTTRALWPLLPSLVTGALSLAIVASLDGLLCAKTVEGVTGRKTRRSRELVRLGVGNMAAACVGGIVSGVNLGASFANHRSGGRTGASVLVTALVILAAALLLPPVIGLIPRVVIAGLLVVVALQLFDAWSIQIVRRLVGREFVYWKGMAVDLVVIGLVATVAIASSLVAAVGIGVGITILSFLFRMSRSAVRRAHRGDVIHSRKTRDPVQMQALVRRGQAILIFELEGPIFFGTAEDLAGRVEVALLEGVSYVILDLKRVNEIDSTGARILVQLHHRLVMERKHLLVSHAERSRRVGAFLADMGVMAALTRQHVFDDTDRALEWAEDHLIETELGKRAALDDRALEGLDVLAGLDAGERETLQGLLGRRTYRKGEAIVREGDPGRELFIIARGTASVKIRLPGDGRETRLATFSVGTVFGEMALLDRQPRSATVEADEALVCYVLTDEAFGLLRSAHSGIAIKLLTNLARELSHRLRRASRTIYELEG